MCIRDRSRAWSGAGESARPGADGLFTRDEVLKMDRAAVSENYDAIRESMSLWDTVSYTHLDVYKRQIRSKPGAINIKARKKSGTAV